VRLEERLRLLRGQEPQDAAPGRPDAARGHTPSGGPAGDLRERLRRAGADTRRTGPETAPDEQALAGSLRAERLAPGVLRVCLRLRLDRRHGRVALGECLSALPHLLDGEAGQPNGWLFLDTETSGLAGGTGTFVFLCGLLGFEGPAVWVRQYLLTRLDAEQAYLEAIAAELARARVLVTYNGKSFDTPLLETRFRLAGVRDAGGESKGQDPAGPGREQTAAAPVSSLPPTPGNKGHLDLLHPVRRAFATIWPDCRLATAERRLLGFVRQGDLPGAAAPAAWLAWLRRGEETGLAAVLRHNRWDLLSLPALTRPLVESFADPRATGADVRAVARHHLTRGDADRALAVLLADRRRLSPPALLDLARLHRRRGEWQEAGAIWGALAVQGLPEAIADYAKYLEHQVQDYARALAWATRLPAGPAREHRRRRIEDKLRG